MGHKHHHTTRTVFWMSDEGYEIGTDYSQHDGWLSIEDEWHSHEIVLFFPIDKDVSVIREIAYKLNTLADQISSDFFHGKTNNE